jgi:glycosyltransferase involved in cell wall biosynthesis
MKPRASNTKKRIAFIVWTLEGMGGSERVVYDLARKIDRNGFELILIGFSDGPVRKRYEDIGVPVLVVRKGRHFDPSLILKLRKVFRVQRIDILNPHHYGPFLYSSIAKIGLDVKMVYTEHSRWQLEELSFGESLLNRVMIARADAVLAISKQIEEYYLRKLRLRREKVRHIGNGIDLAHFKRKDGQSLRQSLGIGANERVIGIVANLRPEKNHKLLISAFSRVAEALKDVKLVLVGTDCMNGEIQKYAILAKLSDRVLFLGQRDDIPELLSVFDVFCLPSIHEGLPLTVLEAMAVGVPIVGSDVMGINEVIENGSTGLLFPAGDEEKLAETVTMVLMDKGLSNRLSSAAREFVVTHFSLDDKVEEYQGLFNSL